MHLSENWQNLQLQVNPRWNQRVITYVVKFNDRWQDFHPLVTGLSPAVQRDFERTIFSTTCEPHLSLKSKYSVMKSIGRWRGFHPLVTWSPAVVLRDFKPERPQSCPIVQLPATLLEHHLNSPVVDIWRNLNHRTHRCGSSLYVSMATPGFLNIIFAWFCNICNYRWTAEELEE